MTIKRKIQNIGGYVRGYASCPLLGNTVWDEVAAATISINYSEHYAVKISKTVLLQMKPVEVAKKIMELTKEDVLPKGEERYSLEEICSNIQRYTKIIHRRQERQEDHSR